MTSKKFAVLVGCGSSKRDSRSIIWKMYRSTYFESKWSVASLLGDPFVLSGKHGLVSVTERVDPYDESWKEMNSDERHSEARDVVDDLPSKYTDVVILAGREYVEPIVKVLSSERPEVTIHDPFQETSGNGEQMGWCADTAQALLNGKSRGDVL